MPKLTWHTLLPTAFLKLVARSHHDDVLSEEAPDPAAGQPSQLESCWAGLAAEASQCDKYTAFTDDCHSTVAASQQANLTKQAQVLPSPFSAPGNQTALNEHSADKQPRVEHGGSLPIAKPVVDGLLPVASRHRRTNSASSDVSLVSAATASTNPGVYTGFTQNGHYDLTQDVVLRGEFISASQSKACGHSILSDCCMCHSRVGKQR